MNTDLVNPYIKKAQWIKAKLRIAGSAGLTPEERVFVSTLACMAGVQGDTVAQRLLLEMRAAHLDFMLTLRQVVS